MRFEGKLINVHTIFFVFSNKKTVNIYSQNVGNYLVLPGSFGVFQTFSDGFMLGQLKTPINKTQRVYTI